MPNESDCLFKFHRVNHSTGLLVTDRDTTGYYQYRSAKLCSVNATVLTNVNFFLIYELLGILNLFVTNSLNVIQCCPKTEAAFFECMIFGTVLEYIATNLYLIS